jgi:hypothetical protein
LNLTLLITGFLKEKVTNVPTFTSAWESQ